MKLYDENGKEYFLSESKNETNDKDMRENTTTWQGFGILIIFLMTCFNTFVLYQLLNVLNQFQEIIQKINSLTNIFL